MHIHKTLYSFQCDKNWYDETGKILCHLSA
jgi:hypothetical protein